MARIALAVGYSSRTGARTENPQLLYLGHSFQAAREAAGSAPAPIGYAEAYRLDAPQKKVFIDRAAADAPNLELPDFLVDTPAAEVPAEEAAETETAPAPEEEPDLDLGTPGRKRGGKA